MSFQKFNRGLVPQATEAVDRTRQLVLVQVRDGEGFWCNRAEPRTVGEALGTAAAIARDERIAVRVVRGPKREIVREFSA